MPPAEVHAPAHAASTAPAAALPAPYLRASYLPSAAPASKLRETTTRLNLRRGATKGSPFLGTLPRCAIVTVTATFGRNLDVDLAYRTLDTQRSLYRGLGPYIAARPGTSNHGWGLAVDFPETRGQGFAGKYSKWLKANSKKYDWAHHRYLERGSPYAVAWHFGYAGR